MGTLSFVKSKPPKETWAVLVDGRWIEENEVLNWIRASCSGDCYYTHTRFAKPNAPKRVGNRVKRIPDQYCYLQYTFWFSKKADAALCRMFWEICRDDT